MKICVLTPALGLYEGVWEEFLPRFSAPLEQAGAELTSLRWTEAAERPPEADLVVPLVAWGYHLQLDRWYATLDALERAGSPVANPPSVLRWNADKSYLERLEANGAPTVPTLFVERADDAAVHEALHRFGIDEVVVKPRVSGGAHGTIRVKAGGSLEGGPEGPAMIQPFLPSVGEGGELSMLFFNRRFSHALTKTAVAGDFRVQPQYGGIIQGVEPPPDAFAMAERVLAAVQEPLLYARVDVLRDREGVWRLIELELIEPHLFLDQAPDRGRAFAEAAVAWAASNSGRDGH